MRKIILLIVALFLLSPAFAYTDNSQSQEIKKVLNDQRTAWNNGDLKSFMAGYWHSPEVTFASAGTIRRGWDEVYQLEKESALMHGRCKLLKGKEKLGGGFSLVLRKFQDSWKIIHDHTSRDEPRTKE